MTQPAQSSRHEQEFICGTCGKEYGSRRELRAHCVDLKHTLASVAQATQPSANYVNDPDYQADVLLAEADALKKFTDYFVANYPGPDTIIYDPHWHAPKIFRAAKAALKLVPAQPQDVPAEQRMCKLATEVLRIQKFATRYAITDAPGWEVLVRMANEEVAAQPASAAKPAEDGLEAQVTAWLFTRFGKRFGWTNEGDIESLANFIRTQSRAAEEHIVLLNQRHLADGEKLAAAEERERELREKLLELAESTDDLLNTMLKSRTFAQRERVAKAIADARALLASHWPAQKESK